MDSVNTLCLIGFSHRTAPVAVRERYAFQPEDLAACLRDLSAAPEVEEVSVLSTCNRTEVLVVSAHGADAEPLVRRNAFRNLPEEHLYVFRGVQAVIHLFRVASGLDSQVLGESEVLAQVKRSFETARDAGSIGKLLGSLLPQTLRVGKRVRNETELGQGTLSVARVGVQVARQVFGAFDDVRALVVGAGETGRLVGRHLRDQGVGALDFANRTREHAEAAAGEFGGRAFGLDELREAVSRVDLVLACIDGEGGVVGRDAFGGRTPTKRDQPLLVIDLSVPRAVAREVAELPNVLLYDIDDLEPVVARNQKEREAATEKTGGILVSELHKFLALRTYASFSPAIEELRRRFDEVRDRLLDEVAGPEAAPRDLQLTHELARRLLDVALVQMKEGARRARSERALDLEYQRFLENL